VRVSTKSDYALRALIELAHGDGSAPLSADEISRAQDIPHGFLQGILADLRRAGVLVSQRGQAGGWLLARTPEEVTVADVIRAMDGPLVNVHGLRPEAVVYKERAASLQAVWIAARSGLREVLENVTIADLVSGDLPEPVRRRTEAEDAWRPH
jgi:Rrf2 family protein